MYRHSYHKHVVVVQYTMYTHTSKKKKKIEDDFWTHLPDAQENLPGKKYSKRRISYRDYYYVWHGINCRFQSLEFANPPDTPYTQYIIVILDMKVCS